MDIVNLAIILLTILTIVYGYFKYSYGYWKARGVPCDEPSIPYGNIKVNAKICSKSEIIKQMYDKYKATGAEICGFYHFLRPIAIILDVDLIKRILNKDSNKLANRNVYYNEMDEPIDAHSSFGALDGERWQKLCTMTLVPAFSSENIKAIFPSFVKVGEQFRDCLVDAIGEQQAADHSNGLEIREWCSRFMTDGIACVFGIECKAVTDEKVKIETNEMSEFITKIVSETIEHRESQEIQRDDLMGILLKLKNDEDKETALTLSEIVAQTYALFEASFSSSATVLTFCLYELAIQFDIQSKARNVINEACSKLNGRFTYEMLVNMTYLDQIIEEILRMYTGTAFLEREVKKDFSVPVANIVLKKGTRITVPMQSIHNDHEYYPDPDLFDPDRFENNEKLKRELIWLSFGSGPRNCIGTRFAVMQIKIGLIQILKNFAISLGTKTKLPIQISKNKTVHQPKDGVYLQFRQLKL